MRLTGRGSGGIRREKGRTLFLFHHDGPKICPFETVTGRQKVGNGILEVGDMRSTGHCSDIEVPIACLGYPAADRIQNSRDKTVFACWAPTTHQLQLVFYFPPSDRTQKLRIRLLQLDGFALGDQGQGKASKIGTIGPYPHLPCSSGLWRAPEADRGL